MVLVTHNKPAKSSGAMRTAFRFSSIARVSQGALKTLSAFIGDELSTYIGVFGVFKSPP